MKKALSTIAVASLILTGCVTPGEYNRADVYDTNQVNKAQKPKIVQIVAVSPVRIKASNRENRETTMKIAAITGAVVGGIIGHNSGHTGLGAGVGAAAGALGGSIAKRDVLTDGVTITYKLNNQVYSSTQVGRRCEFALGEAIMILTSKDETRIQPNATCPTK